MKALEKIKLSREALGLVEQLNAGQLKALAKIKAAKRVVEITALLSATAKPLSDPEATIEPEKEKSRTYPLVSSINVVPDDENSPKPPYNKLVTAFAVDRKSTADISYDRKDSKKLLLAALKGAFPNVKFRIRAWRGDGYSINWVDGASVNMVKRVTDHFRGEGAGSFDQGGDYWQRGADLLTKDADGKIINYNLGMIDLDRDFTDEFLLGVLAANKAEKNIEVGDKFIPDPDGTFYYVPWDEAQENQENGIMVVKNNYILNYQGDGSSYRTNMADTYSDRQFAAYKKEAKRIKTKQHTEGETGTDGETDKITQFFIDVQQGDISIDTDSVKQAIEYAEQAPDNAELGNGTNYIWEAVTTTVS